MASAPKFFSMDRLSKNLSDLKTLSFDVIIVGSGYGGSIAASRLARAGQKVCLLERGDEVLPGQYPTDAASAAKQMRLVSARKGRLSPKPTDPTQPVSNIPGIMEVRVNDDMHVILGTGLGGGSLVNANMSIVPDMRVFESGWPAAFRPTPAPAPATGLTNCLAPYFQTAKTALGAKPLPQSYKPAKLAALEQSADTLRKNLADTHIRFERPDINVTFDRNPNHFGFTQAPCTMCGDCCSGCNYGAKNTLLMNYLPDANLHGATLITLAEVDHVSQSGGQWTVLVNDLSSPSSPPPQFNLQAKFVILSAGALGSTEILFRSKDAVGGPTLSSALGTKFSGNGDVLAFGFGANVKQITDAKDAGQITPLYSIGAGAYPPTSAPFQPGPCITGVIRVDMDDKHALHDGLVIEDGTAPGPLAAVYPAMMFLQEVLHADFADFPDATIRTNALKALGTGLLGSTNPAELSYTGAMSQMQSYLLMSHDPADGKLAYDSTTKLVHVDWPGVGAAAPFPRDNDKLRAASEAIWANFIANPIWDASFGRNVVSVHPLGGCPMSDDHRTGVVDAEGRVYTGKDDNSVYDTLLVCDGAIIPTALGVNPLLTISALSERAMSDLIARNGWVETTTPNPVVPAKPGTEPPPAPVPIDWQQKAAYINRASYAATAVAISCKAGFEAPVKAELDKLATILFSEAPQAPIDSFIKTALNAAYPHLSRDLGPAFSKIAQDLSRLYDAIQTARATDQPIAQAAIDAFFAILGDVSPSLAFDESMQGHVWDRPAAKSHTLNDAHLIAEAFGKSKGRALNANFSVRAKSTLTMTKDQVGADIAMADLSGTVTLTNAAGKLVSYAVTDGTFQLLQPDPDQVETWLMIYDCTLQPALVSEPSWKMKGVKTLQKRDGTAWFPQLTTLYVDLSTDAPGVTNKAQQGIIHLDLQDMASQVLSTQASFTPAKSLADLNQEVLSNLANGTFAAWVASPANLREVALQLFKHSDFFGTDTWPGNLAAALEAFFAGGVAAKFAQLILRTYGGIVAYMQDYPSQDDDPPKVLPMPGDTSIRGWVCKAIPLPAAPANPTVCLFHFEPPKGTVPKRGPVILTPGMSTTALSYAVLTVERSLVDMLLEQNYDVWLFDNRNSPRVVPTNTGYTLDDIANYDWPLAVDYVLANSPLRASTVQVVAHCVGAVTGQMALLGGAVPTAKIRQMVLLQFTALVGANWFNVVKSELGLAQAMVNGFPDMMLNLLKSEINDDATWKQVEGPMKSGMPTFNMTSTAPAQISPIDGLWNTLSWPVPFGIDHVCLSPTCHRIYASYGPVMAHKNINEATHNGMRDIFGEVATKPFEQLGLILQRGQVVNAQGEDVYLPNVSRLDLPIHIMSGELNQILLPEGGYKTLAWLQDSLPDSKNPFTRETIPGYAHNDFIVGKDAHKDIFPHILAKLAEYADKLS